MAPYIRAVGEWAAKQGERSYTYHSIHNCAMAQFHRAHGQHYGEGNNWPNPDGTHKIEATLENLAAAGVPTFREFRMRIEEWLILHEPSYVPVIQP